MYLRNFYLEILAPNSTGCCGDGKPDLSPWRRCEPGCGTSPVPAQLSTALCPQAAHGQGLLSSLLWHRWRPLYDTAATALEWLSPPGLVVELGCLDWRWMWTRAAFQVCVSCLRYGFRWLILSTFLDLQKREVIVYLGRELSTMWVYKLKQKLVLRLR